ncbi:MAG: PEP/pyruvate-binding domain-containing protein [Clostridiales bacterium]|nr:PEP/pyruvate-binding domain-containing protein [Clostridiales bacterium]
MGAFDRIESGLPSVDRLLDSIRMGDNVVWKVTTLEEFMLFAGPFVRQAKADGRNLIYMRFGDHPPLFKPQEGLKIFEFDPDEGFEAFTVDIYNRITEEGRDAFYVFDSLSSLQSAWYTDLMMGNFFCVTCPYLFILDTVAYFPLLRGKHSYDTVARIRDTTQLLLDVHTGEGDRRYLHPLKVWNRYSSKMFLPYSYNERTGDYEILQDGVSLSRYYQMLEGEDTETQDLNYDSHDRFFARARLEYSQGSFSEETEQQILESTMTKDKRLQKMIRQYFRPKDYFSLRDRMVGSGSIGGKACGMLLARRIAATNLAEYKIYQELHDSFYIGSDVFYTYIVSNNCWNIRIAQRTEEGYFSRAEDLKQALLSGEFPPKIRDQFRTILDYYGQSPIILRSSSFLEDGFGNAFAGKYESVFYVNQGSPEERLEAFEHAVRTVYASTMDVSALEYRKMRGLEDKDEQMAVLVQRVSGAYHGTMFFPAAAGVGYSYSAYRLTRDMDPSAGLLRIVAGLGTRAVDRPENDYPRLVNLDRPGISLYASIAERHRFSQRKLDVLDTSKNELVSVNVDSILDCLPLWYRKALMERDYEAEDALARRGCRRDVWFVTCQKLLEDERFTGLMQKLLKCLEQAYGNAVDIEYTVNLDEHGDFLVNLLQCRPLYTGSQGGTISIPDLPKENIFFDLRDSSMGDSVQEKIDVVIQIDPIAYYQFPYAKKPLVANAVGRLNHYYRGSGKHVLLMAPGRLGTSSPELGVPVRFADISDFRGICEVSDHRAGYMPELSYGSHMFQDLVEAEICYSAVWNDRRTVVYEETLFANEKNRFCEICPEMEELSDMFRVTEPEDFWYWNDLMAGRTLCGRKRG